jgi:hypothetical protein
MLHRAVGASMLSPLRAGHDYRPALDDAMGFGWNILRVFCGALPWCGQELAHVYERLPGFLGECQARGFNAYLAYHTEAGTGYELEPHTDEVERIAQAYPVVVLREVANEADHDTQGGRLDPGRCAELAGRMAGPVSYGATLEGDESDTYAGRDHTAVHLDRSRDPWNMVRRVREIYAHTERYNRPANNQEPIGAAEQDEPGRRCADPAIFHTMAALNRLFDVTVDIFHSNDGLDARPLGPQQRACAQAFVAGSRVWPTADVLSYRNAGHEGSPVRDANFDKVVRVYSGLMPSGLEALTVALGLTGSVDESQIELNDGWRWDTLLSQMQGVDGRLVQCWRTSCAAGTRSAPAKGPREWLQDRFGRQVLGEAPGIPR